MPPDDPNPTPQPEPTPQPTPTPSPSPEPQGRFVPADRFDAVVGQKYEAIRRSETLEARTKELEARLASYEQRTLPTPAQGAPAQPLPEPGVRTFGPQTGPISEVELNRLAELRARQITFNDKCNESVAQGRKAYVDFDAKVDDLRRVAPTVDAQGRPMLPTSLVEAALATGRGHEVLYALGSDPSEADRVMSLDPVKQAVEIARFADRIKATPSDDEGGTVPPARPVARASAVPEPIRPVVGGSRKIAVKDMDLADPALPIEEFMRRRDDEATRNRKANGRFR